MIRVCLCFVVLMTALGVSSVESYRKLYWRSNHAGLFSHYLQLKVMFKYANMYNRSLVVEPFTSKHYENQVVSLCDFYDLSNTSVSCSTVPETLECSKTNHDDIMHSSDVDLCYGGPFMFKLTGGKTQREGIVNAIPLDFPMKLQSKQLFGLSEFKKDMGLAFSGAKFTVAHWRRGDQLEMVRCGSQFDTSVNCGEAKTFITKIQQYSTDKVVYVATNEPQTSVHMDTIRAAGFLTLSSVEGLSSHHTKRDQLEVLAIEVALMMEASTFLAWGISEIDDVVEFERKKAGRSFCTAHEHFAVRNGNLTFCHVDAAEVAKKKKGSDIKEEKSAQLLLSADPQQIRHDVVSASEVSSGEKKSGATTQRNTAHSIVHQLNSTGNSGFLLHKTAFSNSSRLLFVAGLEGTGHHALQAMFKVCNRTQHCEVDTTISHALMRYDSKTGLNSGLFGAADAINTARDVAVIEGAMRVLAATPGDHLFFLGLGFVPGTGMLSYPNFNGRHKSLDHPDVFSLAAMAESAGLDFRVLVLQRDAADVIASTKKRGFGGALGAAGEPKILIDNAAALYTQLVMLDRAFVHCVGYRELGNLSARGRDDMATFLHPVTMREELGVMLQEINYSRPGESQTNNKTVNGPPAPRTNDTNRSLSGVNNATLSPNVRTRKPKPVSISGPETPVQKANLEYLVSQLRNRMSLIDGLCSSIMV